MLSTPCSSSYYVPCLARARAVHVARGARLVCGVEAWSLESDSVPSFARVVCVLRLVCGVRADYLRSGAVQSPFRFSLLQLFPVSAENDEDEDEGK